MFNIGDKVIFGKNHLSKIEYEAHITDKHELNPNRYFITIKKNSINKVTKLNDGLISEI
jgi:hypothetical protein